MDRVQKGSALAGKASLARLSLIAAMASLCATLTACTDQTISDSPSVKSLATSTGLRTEVGQPKDFVVRSRRSDVAYVPVEVRPPDRPSPRREAKSLPGVEQELDQTRQKSAGYARRSLPKSQYGGIEDARRSSARARAQASRPIPGAGENQPTGYPVPESRRRGKGTPLALPE